MAPIRQLRCDGRAPRCYRWRERSISRTNQVTAHPSPIPEPFDPQRELAFVRAVRSRDEAAVATFEERMLCVPRFLSALNRRRGYALDEHDLADLVNDTVVIALRKLGEFEAHVPLEGWLYRLCHFELLNALRRRARERRRVIGVEDEDSLPADEPPDEHRHDEVHRALERLGGVEAETVRMKHFDALTFPEIGARLSISTNTVKTRYYRGLQKLEQILWTLWHREEHA